ncbi:MAG: hypothetical protein NTV95_03960 [Candidatus Saccharibacteria bacterium]|nr:hypothetical protein [Candidatus Saccharibacteria bacterium]
MSEFNQSRNVREINPATIFEPHERKAVLAMQATALFGSEGFENANNDLTEAASEIGAAATMTYEDLIFINPLEAGAYVLSEDPSVATQEALFYTSHRSIEDTLAVSIEAIRFSEFDIVTASLQSAGKKFGGLYRQLDPAAFAEFRPYFRGINGYPGPSGLFTAAIPIIDLLSHGGSNITEDERTRLIGDTDKGLYPSHQSDLLRSLLVDERPQIDMPDEVRDSIKSLLNRFRKVHTGSVRRFVPEALDAGAEGSGGVADVAGYLASKMLQAERSAK